MNSLARTGHAGITKKLQIHHIIHGVISGALFTLTVYTPICIFLYWVNL